MAKKADGAPAAVMKDAKGKEIRIGDTVRYVGPNLGHVGFDGEVRVVKIHTSTVEVKSAGIRSPIFLASLVEVVAAPVP